MGRRRLLLIAGVSLTAGLGAGELALRWFAPEPLSGSYRVTTSSGLLVNRSDGGARHQFEDRVVRYEFSPPHLRGKGLDPDRETVLCLGDSFTFGYLLDEQDTTVHLLHARAEAAFPGRYQFVNGAAAGWGLAEMVAFVEELGPEIEPGLVLVFLNHDDVGRAARRRVYTLVGEQGLELERHPIPVSKAKRGLNRVPGYRWLVEHSHLVHLVRRKWVAARSPGEDVRVAPDGAARRGGLSEADCSRLARGLYARLDEWCQAHDSELVVVTTGWHLPAPEDAPFEATRAFLAEAPAFFEDLGVPFHDISPTLLAEMNGDFEAYVIPRDRHPNERGASLTARLVYEEFLGALLGSR